MIKEFIYLCSGIEKKMTDKLSSLIEEGKKNYDDEDDLITMGKKHINKRKEFVKNVIFKDFRDIADDIGIATKKDIDELKQYLRDKNVD